MNKKFSVLIALLLVVALAMPTSAAVFTDVTEDHWAYEAVNQLVAAGIINGYPDGTFQGDNSMTRYEVALAVSRVLDRIAEEREALADEVDAMKDGFTSAQQTELKDIVKSIVEENMPEPEEKDDDEEDGLNETEYEQIANLIEALTFNYKAELQNLNADLSEVEDLMAANKEEVDATIAELKAELEEKMNKVTFSGSYAVDYTDVGIEGDGTPFLDPFVEDFDGDYDVDSYDKYDETADSFYHELTLDTAVKSGPLSAEFSMVAADDLFDGSYDTTDFVLDSLSGQITGNGFDATIEEDQALTIKPYLFDGGEAADGTPTNPVNGVIVNAFDNTYALSDDVDTVFAGTDSMDLLGQSFDFAYGTKKFVDEKTSATKSNMIFGLGTTMDLAGFALSPEFAVSNEDDMETYFTLNAKGDLGPLATTYNLEMIEDFAEIKAADTDSKGHDLTGEMSVSIVDLTAYYDNYEDFSNQYMALDAEITEDNAMNLAGFDLFADTAYYNYLDATDATRTAFNTTAKNTMGKFALTGEINYEVTTANFETEDAARGEYTEEDLFDKTATLVYTMSDAISATAEVVHDVDGELSQMYSADYDKGMFSAGLTKYLNGVSYGEADNMYLTAGLDPEAYDVMEVSLDPYANFGMKMAEDNFMNFDLGFDATKELNEYATMTGGFEFADKEYSVDNAGSKLTYDLGLDYEITSDVSATANYELLEFNADSGDADSYKANKATAGVSVNF